MMRNSRLFLVVIVMVGACSFPFAWRWGMVTWAETRMYSLDISPESDVAIVFGARVYGSGRLSTMLRDRVHTAVDLYHAGKVDRLIMSGGGTGIYDEPARMSEYAISLGVPAADIELDRSGSRTYDSCYRATHVFETDEAILVTQEFHLPRALVTCQVLGVNVFGVVADRRTYSERSMSFSTTREFLASQLAFVDLILRRPPSSTS